MSLYRRVYRLANRYQRVAGCLVQCQVGRKQSFRHFAERSHAAVSFSTQGSTSSSSSSSPDSFRLYDSLSQSIQGIPESSSDNKGLAFYSCGVTPYAPSHLGHARTYVCLDILRRVLEQDAAARSACPAPLFVMNITDVDDKILATANELGQAPIDLARHYEAEFWQDMDALNCLRPHVVTRVTEHVDSDIVPYIERIVDLGMAYETDDGDVYFDVRFFEDKMNILKTKYGKLAPPAESEDFFTTLEQAQTQKHDPRDFVLWKRRKEGERMYWASPWGEGRPGWHIECSAMIQAVQTQFRDTHTFRMHAGGVDLKFPHHTNEIAQAEAYHSADMVPDKEWIPHWVHTGHLHIDKLKMSKSLKNFITIREMLDDATSESSLSSRADDFRLWCLGLAGSYRGPATYSRERIQDAGAIRQKIVRFLLAGEEWLAMTGDMGDKKWIDVDMELFTIASQSLRSSRQALLSDLDGSSYVEEMVRIAEKGNAYLSRSASTKRPTEPIQSALQTLRGMLSLVGFSDATCRAGLDAANDSAGTSNVVGGERALLDELVRFRALVRNAAIADLRDKTATDNTQEIMRLCDDTRDTVFPFLGVELVDRKVGEQDSGSTNGSLWKFCIPRNDSTADTDAKKTAAPTQTSSPLDLKSVPIKEYFKVGQYQGQFSAFSEEGFPTLASDGSELSNRQLKKLQKKRDKHAKRLGNDASV